MDGREFITHINPTLLTPAEAMAKGYLIYTVLVQGVPQHD